MGSSGSSIVAQRLAELEHAGWDLLTDRRGEEAREGAYFNTPAARTMAGSASKRRRPMRRASF
ncbi:MAG TPA: hypothetical protein VLY24_16015 [Bryobacteraceae bacterium]|nr:hypothetical protein [Bryobacteraceae bacterium]